MISKLFTLSWLCFNVASTTQLAETCVNQDSNIVGASASATDTSFNDYEYLHTNEQNGTVYKLTQLLICTDINDNLSGMWPITTRFLASNMTAISVINLHRAGSVTELGINCNFLPIDAVNGDYLSTLSVGYSSVGVQYIKATTSQGKSL